MAVSEPSPVAGTPAAPPRREVIYRHAVVVRATHWINVLCLALLLMSGLCIFNYHPALYWGNYGYRGVPSFASIDSAIDPGSGAPVGVTRIGAGASSPPGFSASPTTPSAGRCGARFRFG